MAETTSREQRQRINVAIHSLDDLLLDNINLYRDLQFFKTLSYVLLAAITLLALVGAFLRPA